MLANPTSIEVMDAADDELDLGSLGLYDDDDASWGHRLQ